MIISAVPLFKFSNFSTGSGFGRKNEEDEVGGKV